PALELARLSRRAAGLLPAEALTWSFSPADLRQWISPFLVPLSSFHPAADWWKCVYLGLAASAAALLGLGRLPRRRALALAALLAAVAVLILGGTNPLSRRLWTAGLSPLRLVRYPGNVSFLALLPLAALVGAGLSAAPAAPAWTLLMAAELLAFGWRSTPLAPRALFTEAGPLVRVLQARLEGTRYLISPRALETVGGRSVRDWKFRLYGLTNAPYRLRAVGNFGEPLVPEKSYAFMDRLYGEPGPAAAAAWMPWAGASRLLTPQPPPPTPRLAPERKTLWDVSRVSPRAALAYRLSPEAGAALPADLPASAPKPGEPLAEVRPRADRFRISGRGAGWVFVSEPLYPGWAATLETPLGEGDVEPLPALGPFMKVPVPRGPWVLRFRYDPLSWRLGVLISLAALLGFGGYWYHRAAGGAPPA
ncbi:MAG: hypothetical protein KGM24_07935, partial [Elusimicrobia bacterium]|nr:hypothetical protein [Elusimicrobiota bacterium]